MAGSSPGNPLDFDIYGGPGSFITGVFSYKYDSSFYLVEAGSESLGPVYAQTITLKAAAGVNDVYEVNITTSDVLDKLIKHRGDRRPFMSSLPFNPDDSTDRMLSTLEGVKVGVSIKNLKVNDWGIDDIDFKNSYIQVRRITDETLTGYDGNIYAMINLEQQSSQTIPLPAASNGYYPSGRYQLEVVLKAKASGNKYTFIFDNITYGENNDYLDGGIFVDNTPESDKFGFAGYEYYFENNEYKILEQNAQYYGPVYGVKDEDGNPLAYSATGNTIIRLPVNIGGSVKLYFTVDDMPPSKSGDEPSYTDIIGARVIKVWNETEGVDAALSKANAIWYYAVDATDDGNSGNSLYYARFVDKAEDVVNAYGNDGHFAYLPLIKNTVNTIAFQVVNANGKVSEKRTVLIEPIAASIKGTVSITNTDKPVKEGKLTFRPDPDQSMEDVNIYVYEYVSDKETGMLTEKGLVDITDKYDLYDNSYSLTLAETGYHKYYVYARDKYGNYTLLGEYEWYLTDDGPATVEEPSPIDDNAEYGYFTARFAFKEISFAYGMEQTLKLYFDKDYMNLLGFEGEKTAEAFTLKLSKDIINRAKNEFRAVYEAETPNSFGIYKVDADWQQVQTGRGTEEWLYVTVYGINKYDDSLEDGRNVTRTLYATLTDPFGYESDPEKGKISFEVANTKPKYVKGYVNEYSRDDNFEWPVNSGRIYTYSLWRFDAEFNTHVKLDKSIAQDIPSNYSMIKYGELPIFKDGTYTVSFYDIFGTKWTQEIVVENQFNEFGLLISLTETGPTAEPVEVMIIPEYMDKVYCTVYEFNGQGIGDSFEPFTVDSSKGLIVQIRNEEKRAFVQQEFYINNILKGKPQAELHWYYHEFNSDTPPEGVTETSKPVTVWYTADRKVFPSGDTGESYTFYPGEGITKYTFEFVDEAGNKGEITAELEIAIVEPQETDPDDTAPKYEIKIYARNNDKDEFRKEFNPDTSTASLKDTIKEAGYVQSYALDILVTEDSPYKFILLSGEVTDIDNVSYDNSVSEEIDGVTLNRNRITVTKPAVFTVVIVDKFNNKSSFTMELGEYIDTTKPTAKVTEEYRDFYKLRLYIELEDKDNYKNPTPKVTLLSPSGLSYVDGKYYYEFTENKTITLYFIDMAGNIGSESITVNSLDRNPPNDSVVWSPCFLYEDGSQDPEYPPYHLMNKDVTAIVKYDKPVVITPSISFNFGDWIPVPEDEYDDYSTYFTLKATSDIAIVTFHQGGIGVRLTATALNGKTTDTYLYLDDIIVKTEPKITKQVTYNYRNGYESGTPVSATITLIPESIDVYCSESAKPKEVISKGQSISFTVSKKGNYTYHFTDIAGNTSVVTVPVDKELDQAPPVITVKNDEIPVTSGNVHVPISLNEDGKLIVIGENNTTLFNGNVIKDEWIEVEIENNGTYEVIAYDKAGNTANSVFSVGSIDKIAPVVTLDPVTVDIRQDSSEEALKVLLGVGCIVSDNKSETSKIDVTYNIDNVDLTVPGVYTVTYEAKDEVGNTGRATRFVRVYSKDELEVLINDRKTYYGSTTNVKLSELKIKVNNPLGNEPYTIYLSSSLRSEGQMKYSNTIIRHDSEGRFSVPSPGFYTLYIVTQSRQTYLIRLNVTK